MDSQRRARKCRFLVRSLGLIVVSAALLGLAGCDFLFEPGLETQYIVAYEEEFVDPASYAGDHAWGTSDTAEATTWVANGALQIAVHTDDFFRASRPTGVVAGDDFRLDAGVCLVAGSSSAEVGVIFRVQDNWDHLRFTLSKDGRMRFRRRVSSSWTTLVDWTPCPSANEGTDCNVITVVANGSRFDFYVNEEWVLQGFDSTLEGGGIGVVATAAVGEPGTHGGFPIVILSEPL